MFQITPCLKGFTWALLQLMFSSRECGLKEVCMMVVFLEWCKSSSASSINYIWLLMHLIMGLLVLNLYVN